nr:FkbM family methyltransferase [Oscillatoria laete-virens]
MPSGMNLFDDMPHLTGSVLLDVGCHQGEFIRKYRENYPDAKCIGFEPNPGTYAFVKRRFQDEQSVVIENTAVSNESGIVDFNQYEGDASTLCSLLDMDTEGFIQPTTLASKIKVSTTHLDNYLSKNNISEVGCLKIDTQGNDLRVLLGANGFLTKKAIRHVLVEMNFFKLYKKQASPCDLFSFLGERDYRFVNFYNTRRNAQGAVLFADALFYAGE